MTVQKETYLPLVNFGFAPDLTIDQMSARLNGQDAITVDVSDIADYQTSDAKILKDSLRKLRKKQAFDQITFEHTSIHEAALNLSMNLAWVFPSEDGTLLLDKCLKSGINGFEAAKEQFMLSPNDDAAKLRGFIMGAAQHFHEIIFTSVYGRTLAGWRLWEPLSVPIYDWIANNGYREVLVVPTSQIYTTAQYNVVRNRMLHSVFGFKDLSLVGIG